MGFIQIRDSLTYFLNCMVWDLRYFEHLNTKMFSINALYKQGYIYKGPSVFKNCPWVSFPIENALELFVYI